MELQNYRIHYFTAKNPKTETSIHKGTDKENAIETFKNLYNHLDIRVIKVEEVPYNWNNADERYKYESEEKKRIIGKLW